MYFKNLTPILTKMTVDVEQRANELTHQIHRELLMQHLDQVKNLTPSFISSIKIYLQILTSMDRSREPNNNDNPLCLCLTVKEFLIKRLTNEIEQVVRLLLLTSHDEDEWISDEWFKQKRVSH
jgi:vinculin